VFRVGRDGNASVFFDSEELQVHALATATDGAIYVGTSPNGKVYRVAQDGTHRVVFDPEETYVWALAVAGDGTLLVGTGEKGAVYAVTSDGASKKLYASKASHVTTMAIGPDGGLVIGTDTPGQVLRIDRAGKAFILLDSPFREIRALRFDPTGGLLVAAMNGRAPTDPRLPVVPPTTDPAAPTSPTPTPTVTTEVVFTAIGDTTTAAPASSAKTTDTKREPKAAVYRIAPDGLWDTLWESSDDLPYDVVADENSVIIATGGKGKVYRVESGYPRVTLLTRAPVQQITGVHRSSARDLLLVTANPGKVYRMGAESAAEGHYVSEVLDASTTSTWGAVRWSAGTPAGTSVTVQTRSGNTSRPDETWSDWSPAITAASGQPIRSPKARYLQWRANLTGKPGLTPVLTSVVAAYLPRNQRPEVKSITVHPSGTVFLKPYSSGEFEIAGFEPGTSDGRNLTSVGAVAPGQTQAALGRKTYQRGLQAFVWKAEDPNEDRLQFDVSYRREGEREWRPLKRALWDALLTWDTTSVPDGVYTLKVVASDAPGSGVSESLAGELESSSFLIDNTPPRIDVRAGRVENGRAVVDFDVKDTLSPVSRVEYSIDALRWRTVFPVDGIADTPTESFRIVLDQGVTPSDVTLRAFDGLGNVVTSAAVGARGGAEPRSR
jgi:hypothetical protein